MRSQGYIIYVLFLVFGVFGKNLLRPTNRSFNGTYARQVCNGRYGGLLHEQNIEGKIKRDILEKYIEEKKRITFWFAGCHRQENTDGSKSFITTIYRNGTIIYCLEVDCSRKYHILCLSRAKDQMAPAEESSTVTTTSNTDTLLSRKFVLRNIVIPCTSVLLLVLIVIGVVWQLRREKAKKSVKSSHVYANTTFEGRDQINRQISNMTYAVQEDACIIKSYSAEYDEIKEESARGHGGKGSCCNADSDGDTENAYSHATLPIANSSAVVDVSTGYSNINEFKQLKQSNNAQNVAIMGTSSKNTRSPKAFEHFYHNTLLW